MIRPIDIILVLLPVLSGFTLSWLFPVPQARKQDALKLKLPSWLFGTVWSVLYLLIGIAWARANRENKLYNIPFALLVITLLAWILVNRVSELGSLAVLVASIALSLSCSQLQKFWLTPLTGWLIFALVLSMLKYCS